MSKMRNTSRTPKTSMADKPIWGMTHVFGVYVLWGRETAQSFEIDLGEFKTLESLKEFAEQHHRENAWAQYRAGLI